MFLLRLFGSKKLIAVVTGVVALVAVPLVNAKFGLGLDPLEVAGSLGGIAGVVLAFIGAQYRIDMHTEGETTTSKMLERVAASEVGPVPAKVLLALQLALMVIPAGPGRDAVAAALAEYGQD
jgi:hypothetical protein